MAGVAAVAAGLVAVAGIGVTASLGGPAAQQQLPVDPAVAAPLDPSGWAISTGSLVTLGNGETATLPDAVKSIYYTSAGTVVRTGEVAYTDAPDSAYALVTDDGEIHSLGLELGDRAPSTDPTLPYVAYAEGRGGDDEWSVVLRDVRSGDVAATIPIEGDFTWGGWNAPPVALDGDHVYVGLDDATLDVEWRTGAVSEAEHLPASRFPTVTAGLEVLERRNGNLGSIVDVATGAVVVEDLPAGPAAASVSPDGRYALLVPWRTCDEGADFCSYDDPTSEVIDLADGSTTTVDLGDQVGWTPDGRLIRVTDDAIDLCLPLTGDCTSTGMTVQGGPLKVGGNSYES